MRLILEMIMPISYYYISDLHLFHEAAIRFDDRLFSDADSFFRKSVIYEYLTHSRESYEIGIYAIT